MRCWRITHPRYALDRLCAGAALYGGRWNPVGLPALYCGASISMTALEKLVHLGPAPRPPLALVAVDLPDNTTIFTPTLADLPADWNRLPTSSSAQAFGAAWLRQIKTLAMEVPSVIVPEESNLVINPHHPGFAQVQLTVERTFSFDERLIK